MADEIRITSGLNIRNGNLQYQSQPQAFQADMDGDVGPTPGAFTVSTSGTDVDLSELVTPGVCRVMNIDDTNYVEWGPYDPDSDLFYPVGELLPGESFVFRLSRFLNRESTGTGTLTGGYNSVLRFRANAAACVIIVDAFEK